VPLHVCCFCCRLIWIDFIDCRARACKKEDGRVRKVVGDCSEQLHSTGRQCHSWTEKAA